MADPVQNGDLLDEGKRDRGEGSDAEQDAPAAKRQRSQEPEGPPAAAVAEAGAPAADAGAADEEIVNADDAEAPAAADEEPAADAAPAAPARDPVAIGYKTFVSGRDCYQYFHHVISKYRKNQNLNDYEFHNVLELIRTGHPEAERKLEGGVQAIQIRDVLTAGVPSSCFHLLRASGVTEDVSYRKCVANLFSEMKELVQGQGQGQGGARGQHGGRGGGRRGGRGGGGGGGGGGRGGRGGGGRRGGGRRGRG